MFYKNLVIIDNEKISKKNGDFYCDNFEAKISEDLNKELNVTIVARKSKIDRASKINLEKVKISSNIFSFLINIFKTFGDKETNYLIISITPYTFLSYILLFIFNKKVFVYLRSDGHEEYKAILGFLGPIIYNLMFRLVTFKSRIITCQKRLFIKRKCELVFPSELDSSWQENNRKPSLDKPRLLYVGRIKIEKGIFSLLEIFSKVDVDLNLTVAGRIEKSLPENNKVSFIGHVQGYQKLIEVYDSHNIFILPSFTEAHPKVVDESLSRLRPVIIFDEIEHIVQNKKGIFVSKRNVTSLKQTIKFIMENYNNIQEEIKNNKLPTKQEFISQILNILKTN